MKKRTKEEAKIHRERFNNYYTEFGETADKIIGKYNLNKGEILAIFTVRFLRLMESLQYSNEEFEGFLQTMLEDYKRNYTKREN